MGKQGVRSKRGQGEVYEQPKDHPVYFLMTAEGFELLTQKIEAYRDAEGNSLSRAEYFERFARGTL